MWLLLDKSGTPWVPTRTPPTDAQRAHRLAMATARYPERAPFTWVEWTEADGPFIPVESAERKAATGKTAVQAVAAARLALAAKVVKDVGKDVVLDG